MSANPQARTDRAHLPWREVGAAGAALAAYLVIWAAVAGGWGPVRRDDATAVRNFEGWVAGHPAVVDALKALSLVFSPNAFRIIGLVVVVVLWLRRRRAGALYAFVGIAVGSGLDALAKWSAQRPRPVVPHPVATGAGWSFPSGHALGAVVGSGVLVIAVAQLSGGRIQRLLVVAAAVVVLAVGASRVGLGVHYVSDVVAGWLLGAAWLVAVTTAFGPALAREVRADPHAPSSSAPG